MPWRSTDLLFLLLLSVDVDVVVKLCLTTSQEINLNFFSDLLMVVSGLLVILVQLNVCLQIVPGLILFVMISRKSCQDWNIVMVKLIVLMVLMSLLLVVSNQPFYPLVEAVICCFVYIYVFYFNVVRFNYVVYTESTNWIIIHFCCRLLPQ